MIGRNTSAGERLTSFAQRMERLLDDIDALRQDLKELKAEAKSDGFDVPVLTRLVAIRRNKRRADREGEALSMLMLYAHATGTPLHVELPGMDLPGHPSVGSKSPTDPLRTAAE
jgi:uncharacterized protein (UPF0335 family)